MLTVISSKQRFSNNKTRITIQWGSCSHANYSTDLWSQFRRSGNAAIDVPFQLHQYDDLKRKKPI